MVFKESIELYAKRHRRGVLFAIIIYFINL